MSGGPRAPGTGGRLLSAASGLLGGLLLVLMVYAAVAGERDDPFGSYLLGAAALAGMLGLAAAWLLHRRLGWPLSAPRALALSAVAGLLVGPAGAWLLPLATPSSAADPFEWLELGLLGGVPAALLAFAVRRAT